MINLKEVKQAPTRQFEITSKTSWDFLRENYVGPGKNKVWGIVAEDIAKNAKELEQDIDWENTLKHLSVDLYITRSPNINAIAHTIAKPVANIAVNMGWNMDSPEIVYISGFYFYQLFKNRTDYLEEQQKNLNKRKFLTDEDRQRTLAKEQSEAGEARENAQKLKNALDEYADQSLPQDPAYLNIIQSLLYLHDSIPDREKRGKILKNVLGLLKDGDLLGCLELIWRCTS